jgi:phosphate transport system substrate-binding protein
MNRPTRTSARLRTLLLLLVSLSVVVASPGVAHATVYAQIEGTGSTWSQLIVAQWISDVNANGMQVVYTGGGSSKGRRDFANDSVDFAISEIPYQGKDEQGNADTSNGRGYAYLPIVAGGTAFTYQLKVGGQMVRNLRLSGQTLARIFTDKITNWDDPAITKDNNGRKFPDLPITPVVRSDGSGTTAQLTTWMNKEYPSIWRPYFGHAGLTSYYPIKNGSRMVGQAGSDQVMNTVSSFAGNGDIGYVEYSYPVNKNYPVVKVLNKAGYFVEPTQYNTAVALTQARINQDKSSQLYLTQILDQVYTNPDSRAYPISSYSYMIIPTDANDPRMSTAKRQTLADFLYYSLCQGQSKAGPYGYSPLPLNLVQAGFSQIAKLKKADPKVNLTNRNVTTCNNPTFVAGHLSENHLAQIAPKPAACDKIGAGPCGSDTGNNEPSTDGGSSDPSTTSGGTDGTSSGDPGTTRGNGKGNAPPGSTPGSTTVDPATGALTEAQGGTGTVYANATQLVSDRPADDRAFGWLAAGELLALVLVPGIFVVARTRRRRGEG